MWPTQVRAVGEICSAGSVSPATSAPGLLVVCALIVAGTSASATADAETSNVPLIIPLRVPGGSSAAVRASFNNDALMSTFTHFRVNVFRGVLHV